MVWFICYWRNNTEMNVPIQYWSATFVDISLSMDKLWMKHLQAVCMHGYLVIPVAHFQCRCPSTWFVTNIDLLWKTNLLPEHCLICISHFMFGQNEMFHFEWYRFRRFPFKPYSNIFSPWQSLIMHYKYKCVSVCVGVGAARQVDKSKLIIFQ